MSKEDKLYKIWVYLQAEPLFWITLTLGAFLVGDYLYKKSKLNPLVNPVAISILIVSTVLLTLDVSYDRYFNGAKFIHFMLGPATVALAIPIYEKKDLIFKEIKPIIFSILLGIPFAILITYYLASFFNLNQDIILTMIPRNVTAPIAMGIAELIGGIPSLTAIITIITGIVGASLGTFALNIFKIKDMSARGFGFGLASHGIGTARAMSKNKTAGVFAELAMGLSGIATSIFVIIILKIII